MRQRGAEVSEEPNAKGRPLEKLQAIATIFSLVAVPIIIAVLGYLFQNSAKQADAKAKLVELAIEVLKEPPVRNEQPGLRQWAVGIIEQESGQTLSNAARQGLTRKPLFPMQPVQTKYSTGGFVRVPMQLTSGENWPDVGGLPIKLMSISKDTATFSYGPTVFSLVMNDTVVLPRSGCVFHLLGFEHQRTDDEIAKGTDDPKEPLNGAFTAYVCS